MKRWSVIVAVAVLSLGVFGSAGATTLDFNKYSFGFQFADPATGVSGLVDVGERVSLQGIIGLVDIPTVAGRLRYAFMRKRFFDFYGYGMIGYTDQGGGNLFGGAGGGVEWDWRMIETSLPPLSWSLEAGYNYDDVTIGLGLHYTF